MASQRIIDLPADTNPPLTSVTVSVNGTTYEQVTWANLIQSMINNSSAPSNLLPTDGLVAVSGGSNAKVTPSGIVSAALSNNSFMRNKIINGGMGIDQRNANAVLSAPTSGQYACDRWNYNASQSGKFATQSANIAPFGPPSNAYLNCASNSAYSVGASDFFNIQQSIEANNVTELFFGTASAKSVTVSFWANGSIGGTYSGCLKNYAGTRSYPFTFTLTASTWKSISVTIPGDTSGTWVMTGNGGAMSLCFNLGAGTSALGTAGAWASANYNGATGSVSTVGTNGASLAISSVQLESGSQATPFEQRLYGTELALCQRYYYGPPASYGPTGQVFGAGAVVFCFPFPVVMRAVPTFSVNNPALFTASTVTFGVSGSFTTIAAFNSSPAIGTVQATGASGLVAGNSTVLLNLGGTGTFGFSAEL